VKNEDLTPFSPESALRQKLGQEKRGNGEFA
jgi:hypothetical protein